MARKKKVIQTKSVSVQDLMNLIGKDVLESISKELNADKWVIKLKSQTVFSLILYSLFDSTRISLRIMENNYSSVLFKAIENLAVDDQTAHSSIRDRLKVIKSGYFEKIYQHCYDLLGKNYTENELSKFNLKRYDSTMIAVFSHLLQGMEVGNISKNKNQVKLTTELTNGFQVRMKFFTDQEHLSEETALKEVIQEVQHDKKDLIVFDRGLKSRQSFKDFADKNTQFVTRLNENARYVLQRHHLPIPLIEHDELEIIQDSIVFLYGKGNTIVKEPLRLIEAKRKEDGKKIFFLSNILDLSAYMIGYIYRQRWQIEVFFRFMKQEMNLTHFVCNDENAIKVMLYCTLIAAMLILVYKKQNGIKSYKFAKIQFFKELQANIILEVLDSQDGVEKLKIYLKTNKRKL